jgi:hypothetical protein
MKEPEWFLGLVIREKIYINFFENHGYVLALGGPQFFRNVFLTAETRPDNHNGSVLLFLVTTQQ